MTELLTHPVEREMTKGPVQDTKFDEGGVTYIRPAPAIGGKSDYCIHGRPRRGSTGLKHCPTIATTFPLLSKRDWNALSIALGGDPALQGSIRGWRVLEEKARQADKDLCSAVFIKMDLVEWRDWCRATSVTAAALSLFTFANDKFEREVRTLLDGASELKAESLPPPRYVLVVTEIIGQDRGDDISHVSLVTEHLDGRRTTKPLASNTRAFHEYALALGAAYAIRESVTSLRWAKNLRYAWV